MFTDSLDNINSTNIALLVEYDGSNFLGFQKQDSNIRTVQRELELALSIFTNNPVDIITSGRTDTKVHATYQIVNFLTSVKREMYGYVRGINALLPKDIVIRKAAIVDNKFNARFDAISRTYHYYLRVDPVRSAILKSKVGWYHSMLDYSKMLLAGNELVGLKDFSSFRAANCQAKNPIRNLTSFELHKKHNLFRFEFTANAFLYHMVRNMVGALVYVGNGKLSIEGFKKLIDAKNRKLSPPTFMPDGLYLTKVEYLSQPFTFDPDMWLF